MLQKYKDIFGKPGEGVHRYRFGGIAIVDLVLTVVVAVFISYRMDVSFWKVLLSLLILGVIAHRLFGVKTAVDKKIFG